MNLELNTIDKINILILLALHNLILSWGAQHFENICRQRGTIFSPVCIYMLLTSQVKKFVPYLAILVLFNLDLNQSNYIQQKILVSYFGKKILKSSLFWFCLISSHFFIALSMSKWLSSFSFIISIFAWDMATSQSKSMSVSRLFWSTDFSFWSMKFQIAIFLKKFFEFFEISFSIHFFNLSALLYSKWKKNLAIFFDLTL